MVDVPEAQMVSGNSLKKQEMKTNSPSATCIGHNAARADEFCFFLPGGCDWKQIGRASCRERV